MITYEEALELTQSTAKILAAETIETISSLGRVLAEDVVSDMDMPPFDKSAMDGYACRIEDIEKSLEIIERIPAGKIPQKKIGENQCAKIMTGAMIPEGATCVLMIEKTVQTGEKTIQLDKKVIPEYQGQPGAKKSRLLNICYKGEDMKSGEVILKHGKIIKPQHIAMMASVGHTHVKVGSLPSVAVIPTGDEIVEPNKKPEVSEIRNSNGFQLIAQIKNLGIQPSYLGIARDIEDQTIELIENACANNDVLILTGGVSKGDYDLVPEILKKLRFELYFEEIAVQPGMPTVFGKRDQTYCFALPGNPVSAFVQFETLIKPFLYKLMGLTCKQIVFPLPLASDFSRKKADRKAFYPIQLTKKGEAEMVEYHGSAHINGYVMAWGIMEVEIGVKTIAKGDSVYVRQI
jgi:molybdopterin molybdotransferase